ncbi:MAG: class I SAM-dependent methyltransferase [Candidatus Bathyarchaeota archaeon]|nr:class I SAM-dependent methyltransferase [Candidatus Bathyarchaeum sp.]
MTKNGQAQSLDWNQIWKDEMEKCSLVGLESGTLKQWSTSEAERFLQKSGEKYVKLLTQKLNITADDDVIDVGCGPGRLTIPLAKTVNSVTAVDVSTGMLEVLKRRAKEESLDNIIYVNKYWREVTIGKEIKKEYDVALASNCINLLGAKEAYKNGKKQLDWNLKEALKKINFVGKNNYLTMPVMHHKGFSEIFTAVGKQYHPFPKYITVHNVLYQMGIKPEIDYFSTQCKRHTKPENVIERIEWLCDIKSEQKQMIKDKIYGNVDKSDKGLQVWALIHWHQNQAN